MESIINLISFPLLVVIWLAFGVTAVRSPTRLDALWRQLCGWPLIVQVLAWLLLSPIMLALWIWQSAWPFVIRAPLVASLAAVTIYLFLPGPS